MGRKQKLRKQRKQTPLPIPPTLASTSETGAELGTTAGATICVEKVEVGYQFRTDADNEFPESDFYIEAEQLFRERRRLNEEIMYKYMSGATENWCVHSLFKLGGIRTHPEYNGKFVHLGQPYFLEGAIRGSTKCALFLCKIYANAIPRQPSALMSYWMKMINNGWNNMNNDSDITIGKSDMKEYKNFVERRCVICLQKDTLQLTLRQCMGCSMSCYCSEKCQICHWEGSHKGECRQLKFLNKYHKPHAKVIRNSAILGESHLALKKLRSKLGLSRPLEEYEELRQYNMHEGKSINPFEFLIAREDGTVWIGSTRNPIEPPSSDTDSTTTTTTNFTTTITDVMSMKIGGMKTELKKYGICTDTFIEKSEFIDALRKARNGTDRKPKSTVE